MFDFNAVNNNHFKTLFDVTANVPGSQKADLSKTMWNADVPMLQHKMTFGENSVSELLGKSGDVTNYQTMADDCASKGMRLPKWIEVCKDDKNPIVRSTKPDMWIPLHAHPRDNQWLSIGTSRHPLCTPLSRYHSSFGRWMTNNWSRSYKGEYICVSSASDEAVKVLPWANVPCEQIQDEDKCWTQNFRGCYYHPFLKCFMP